MENFSDDSKAFLFEGVGIEYRNFLKLFNKRQLSELKCYSEIISSELNIDIWSYINNQSNSDRVDEFLEWILIYTCDYIVYQTYIKNGIKPKIFVGYSMGIITAMTCAEAISFESGLMLLKKIYTYPTITNRKEEAMATIIGFDYDYICEIIEEVDLEEYVQIASENSDYCIVISGTKNAVYKIMDIAEERGAIKAIKLNSTYAFHSHCALKGIEIIHEHVKDMEIKQAKVPIISIFTQNIISEKEELRNELIVNIYSSMRWKDSILKLGSLGVKNFVEISLNNYLTKISKAIDLEYDFMIYEQIMDCSK